MHYIYLGIVFLTIVVLLACKRTLYQAILVGLLETVLLFQIPFLVACKQVISVFTNWSSFQILVSLYCITFLQRMLEKRKQIQKAQQDLNNLFHNNRINASIAPLFIGLLPSAAAMILCADIVSDATKGYLSKKEQAFFTSWFLHIPESTLPTYASVLLMSNLSAVALHTFMLGMILPVIALACIGYFTALLKIPKSQKVSRTTSMKTDLFHLFQHVWSFLFIVILILCFHLSVVTSILIVIVACIIVYQFTFQELLPLFQSSFEKNMLFNTFLVLVFKEYIGYTGVLEMLPATLSTLPIPSYLIFVILFFIGGIIALGTPIAFSTLHAGMPLMVLLMCITHAASQLSPTNICLVVASEYYGITLSDLIKVTLPKALLFCIFAIFYYNILLILHL